MNNFEHLKFAKQSYKQHFQDSLKFSWLSLKASFYFFVHAIYPDVYKDHGSKQIQFLQNKLKLKLNEIKENK